MYTIRKFQNRKILLKTDKYNNYVTLKKLLKETDQLRGPYVYIDESIDKINSEEKFLLSIVLANEADKGTEDPKLLTRAIFHGGLTDYIRRLTVMNSIKESEDDD